MKAKEFYLKGKSVFIISLIVIVITILIVFLSGINFNRTISNNFYLSLGIIGICLFLFMNYGLYYGIGLRDDFPKYEELKPTSMLENVPSFSGFSEVPDVGDGIGGMILGVILWIIVAIALSFLLIYLAAAFWFSIIITMSMLYWIFFRAMKFVFDKSDQTKGDLGISSIYSIAYTLLYTGWIFAIVYIVDTFV